MHKLLVLGGSPFQVPAITQARKAGHHVITCDYLPGNPGHRLAHEYYNVSTTDRVRVLELARTLRVDGILAFASDPAAPTAAHVAASLNLPGSPPQAVDCLTNKAAFRTFQRRHGFIGPQFSCVGSVEDACEQASVIGFPVMLKPCDSSGSKGISRVERVASMNAAVESAQAYSRSSQLIVERWVERNGPQIAGDGLVVEGRLVFGCFGDEHFDPECCPHAPVGESFPGTLSAPRREELFGQLQDLFTLLGIRNMVFNLDAMIDSSGRLFIVEIGPRAGGNCLPSIIRAHTGVDLVDIAIRQALGITVPQESYHSAPTGFHASWMIHACRDGILQGVSVADEARPYIRELELIVQPGTPVKRFTSARDTLGYALLSFPDALTMRHSLSRMSHAIEPVLA